MKRMSITVFFLVCLILAFPMHGLAASPPVVFHTSSVTMQITRGVTHEHITRFDQNGWHDIHVIRADLTDPYIKPDAITNKGSIIVAQPTRELASLRGAIAAINASFFNPMHQPQQAATIGTVIESDRLKSASVDINQWSDHLATISIDRFNRIAIDYLRTSMALQTPLGDVIPIARFNKPYYGYEDLTVWDRSYGLQSVGSGHTALTEVVVDRGFVVQVRKNLPPVAIPENGYVIITKGVGARWIESLRPGTFVQFTVTHEPSWSNVTAAVTGGAVLLKNGVIPARFTHPVTGTHPRSAVGVSKNGKELIMVTVDGRRPGAKGMTMQQLASLMLDLGAYDALNMDGGGSTTMVARSPGMHELQTLNRPSGGVERSVPTVLGLFTSAPSGGLHEIILHTEDHRMFVDTSRAFEVKGLDMFFNPVDMRHYQPRWQVEGVEGTFIGSVFYPTATGDGIVTATVGHRSASMPIRVLEPPIAIEPPAAIRMAQDQRIPLPFVYGIDREGYRSMIAPEHVRWSVPIGTARIEDGSLVALRPGAFYGALSVSGVKTHVPVFIARSRSTVLHDFETADMFSKQMQITSAMKFSGQSAGMLFYHFAHRGGMQAVYAHVEDDGFLLDESVSALSIMAFNHMRGEYRLRAIVVDRHGVHHTVTFAHAFDWSGWKRLDVMIEHIPKPARLQTIFVDNAGKSVGSGFLYLDDLSAVTLQVPPMLAQKPSDVTVISNGYRTTDPYESIDGFRFTVAGGADIEQAMRQIGDVNFFVREGQVSFRPSAQSMMVPTDLSYAAYESDQAAFLMLDTRGRTLTRSPLQWSWLISKLDEVNADHVFLIMGEMPDQFADPMEAALLQSVLEGYRSDRFDTVWVIGLGDTHGETANNGIRHIRLAKENPTDSTHSLCVTIQQGEVHYQRLALADK